MSYNMMNNLYWLEYVQTNVSIFVHNLCLQNLKSYRYRYIKIIWFIFSPFLGNPTSEVVFPALVIREFIIVVRWE